jgi:phosphoglycerol transferase MdoB-like AlkP superfamily enzyme
MPIFYLGLAIIGTLIPYAAFVPWLLQNGVGIPQFLFEAMANPISIFAWLDVILAAIALIGFIIHDGQKNQVKWRFIAIVGTLSVGVSCGLPLYLYLRERQRCAE